MVTESLDGIVPVGKDNKPDWGKARLIRVGRIMQFTGGAITIVGVTVELAACSVVANGVVTQEKNYGIPGVGVGLGLIGLGWIVGNMGGRLIRAGSGVGYLESW